METNTVFQCIVRPIGRGTALQCVCHNSFCTPMSDSITSLREEDVREQEGQNPPEAESSFGDILNQFEQSHTHEAPGEKGVEATVVTVSADKVFFDIGQKIEGVLPVSVLRDEKGLIEVK